MALARLGLTLDGVYLRKVRVLYYIIHIVLYAVCYLSILPSLQSTAYIRQDVSRDGMVEWT